jgi:hypothetical protein
MIEICVGLMKYALKIKMLPDRYAHTSSYRKIFRLRKMWILIIYVNPLKPKLVEIIFKNSVRTAKKTQLFTITKVNWLMLVK